MRLTCSLLWLCACGDDAVSRIDAGRPDSGGMRDDAGALRPDAGESDAGGPDAGPLPSCDPTRLLVTTSDYVTGRVGTVDLETFAVEVTSADSPDQDSLPDGAECSAFVLERALGRVRVVSDDPLAAGVTVDLNDGRTMIYSTNPTRVIAVSPTKAYALLQGRNEIAVFDPSAAAPAVTTIDLSGFHDADDIDGVIDLLDALFVNGRLVVALGRYWFDDGFMIHFEGSLLVAIDVATDAVVDFDDATPGVQGIDLTGENPWRGLRLREDGTLLVGSAGDSFAIDGGIERVDLEMGMSLGFVLTEDDLGNELNGFVPDGLDAFFVIKGLDLVHVAAGEPPEITTMRAGIDGLFANETTLFAWSRMTDPGLRAYSLADGVELTPGGMPIEVGDLPIYGVASIR